MADRRHNSLGTAALIVAAIAVFVVAVLSLVGGGDPVDPNDGVDASITSTSETVTTGEVSSPSSDSVANDTSSSTTSTTTTIDPRLEGLSGQVDFPIGVAAPGPLVAGGNLLDRPELQALLVAEFDEITPENIMKPDLIHPQRDVFDFGPTDRLVDFATATNTRVHGHALVFQAFNNPQMPDWMLNFQGSPEEWRAMLDEHIETIVSRYVGRIQSWDVVNEILSDADGSIRPTVWQQGIGDGFVEDAFRAARRADANADLYLNDYKFPDLPHKLDQAIAIADDFQERGVPIDGLGFQMHVLADFPKEDAIRLAFRRAAATGLKVKITELDVRVNSGGGYQDFGDDLAAAQAEQIRIVIEAYLDEVPAEQRGGITMWGISDPDSYLAGGPDWPLLFTDTLERKPAYDAFRAALAGN